MSIMSAISILVSLATLAVAIWTWRVTKKTDRDLVEARRRLEEAQGRNRGNVR